MAKFTFTPLSIPDVILVEPKLFEDSRGYFVETYNQKDFEEAGIKENFVQDNFSFSKKGVIRGLHFSKSPHETVKLVRCISGEILDVAVEIVYKVIDYYFPESEQGIIYNDKDLAINWPISNPILSDKDKILLSF